MTTDRHLAFKRARDHMLLLGRRTPQEKVAMFLLDIARRLRKGDRFELPMASASSRFRDTVRLANGWPSRFCGELARRRNEI